MEHKDNMPMNDAAQSQSGDSSQKLQEQMQQAAAMVDAGLGAMIDGMKAIDPSVADKLSGLLMNFKEALGIPTDRSQQEEGIPGGAAPGVADHNGGAQGVPASPAGVVK